MVTKFVHTNIAGRRMIYVNYDIDVGTIHVERGIGSQFACFPFMWIIVTVHNILIEINL